MRTLIRAAARLAFRARGYCSTRIGDLAFRTDPYHIGFWRDVSLGQWEPATFAFLKQALSAESTFADIGAWIGPTTIFAARTCKQVYCFEPDHSAFRFLLWNLELNSLGNVQPFHLALGASTGLRRMSAGGDRLGDSKSTLLSGVGTASAINVSCIRWSDWLQTVRPGRVHVIKIDIEGGEFELLPTMRDYLASERPTLHLSLHAPLLPEHERESKLQEAIEVLRLYDDARTENGDPVPLSALLQEARGRYCSFVFKGEPRRS